MNTYLEMIVRKMAYDQKLDYDELNEQEKKAFVGTVLRDQIPELVKLLGEEVKNLDKADQYELAIEYIINYKVMV